MIQLRNIEKRFQRKGTVIHAVNDVSLQIEDGEIFGIIGFSGAGKSTLVRCLNLLERPDKGSVILDGTVLTELSDRELRKYRKKIGMIFQHFNLFPSRTIFENVAYPLWRSGLSRREKEEKVAQLLNLVDISEKRDAYPRELSGGQKQRVAIARALANEPKLLLCDEATSALDPQTTKSILQLLKRLNQELGISIVLITHEMAVVKEICDRVAVMDRGSIVESGDVFTIFSAPKEDITRQFIRTTSNLGKVEELIEAHSEVVKIKDGQKVVRLSYLEKNTSEALISEISRNYHVDLNVIFADVEIVQDAPIGGTVGILGGEAENIQNALRFLEGKHVKVEVLQDGTVS